MKFEIPKTDELILNVPLSRTTSGHSKHGKRLVRAVNRDKDYHHLRIFLYFDSASIDP